LYKVNIKAPGKIILFGEHLVIYGYPAIAAAISRYSSCCIEPVPDKILIELTNFNEKFQFLDLNEMIIKIPSRFKQISYCLELFHDKYDVISDGIKITIDSSLFPSAGLGSSASIAVALVSALTAYYKLNLSRDAISEIAFELEKMVHALASGIDNTACTFGNLLFYQEGKYRALSISYDLPLLITYTNIERDTKSAIEKVKQYTMSYPKDYRDLFEGITQIISAAEQALKDRDFETIGHLMSENHEILTKIGVSNEIIEKITQISLKNGAFGSKLTGGGLGGCVISIAPYEKLEKISKILKKKGYPSFITKIDTEGVNIEPN